MQERNEKTAGEQKKGDNLRENAKSADNVRETMNDIRSKPRVDLSIDEIVERNRAEWKKELEERELKRARSKERGQEMEF